MKIINPEGAPSLPLTFETYKSRLLKIDKEWRDIGSEQLHLNPNSPNYDSQLQSIRVRANSKLEEIIDLTVRAVLDTNNEAEVVEIILRPIFLGSSPADSLLSSWYKTKEKIQHKVDSKKKVKKRFCF
jgi:hypothetical protein